MFAHLSKAKIEQQQATAVFMRLVACCTLTSSIFSAADGWRARYPCQYALAGTFHEGS